MCLLQRNYRGYIGVIYGFYRDYIGLIRYILGLHRDNGKENGNYYNGVI